MESSVAGPPPHDALTDAFRHARAQGWGVIDSGQLLAAVCEVPSVAGVCQRTGLSGATIREALWASAYVGDSLSLGPDRGADRVLGMAAGIAVGLGRREHQHDLLTALVYVREGSHVDALRRLGSSRQAIWRAMLEEHLDMPNVDPPPDVEDFNEFIDIPEADVGRVARALTEQARTRTALLDPVGASRWGLGVADQPGLRRLLFPADPELRAILEEVARA